MLILSALCVVAAAALVTAADESLPGSCPDVPAALNFNATAMSGVWFDQAHTRRGTGLDLRCDLVKFAAPSSSRLTFNSFTYSSATKQIISVSGEADVVSSGKLNVNISSLKLHGEVRVLSTDYTTFAVLWACEGASSHSERSLVLTRDKHASSNLLQAAVRVLENNNLSKKDLSYTSQHKCHEYNLNAEGLSSSLGPATSMGSLISVHTASGASTPAGATSTTTQTPTTQTPTTKGANLAQKAAQKVWSSITG